MAADADIVLNTAADPARAESWLPGPVHGADAVHGGADGEARRYEFSVTPEEHELRWHPVDRDGWRGFLRVADRGAGSSEAELCVQTDGEAAADDVRYALERALEGLAAEVEQNFNAG